ncbi:MAG: hypothetical protein ACXVFU_02025 [Nocardioidaceae bacterium]
MTSPPATTPPVTTPVLSEAQVVRRCAPQVYARHGEQSYRGIRGAVLGLAYRRDYRPGDLVRLVDVRGLPAAIQNPSFPLILCRIPEAGARGWSEPRASGEMTGRRLQEWCAETYSIPSRPDPRGWRRPDLRDARVVASESAHGVTAALFSMGGKDHGCVVAPPADEASYSAPDRPVRGYRTWFLPIAVARRGSADELHWVYAVSGRVPAGAHTLRFIRSDGTTASVPVSEDGAYAMVVQDSAATMTHRTRYEFRAADGALLGSGPALRR